MVAPFSPSPLGNLSPKWSAFVVLNCQVKLLIFDAINTNLQCCTAQGCFDASDLRVSLIVVTVAVYNGLPRQPSPLVRLQVRFGVKASLATVSLAPIKIVFLFSLGQRAWQHIETNSEARESLDLEVTQTQPAGWNRSALISVIRTTPMRYSKWFLLLSMHRWFVLFYCCLLAKTRLVSICCYCYCCYCCYCCCCCSCCGWCWCECGIVLYGCLSFIVWLLHIYLSSMYSLYFHAVWSNRSSSCRSRRRQPQIRSRNTPRQHRQPQQCRNYMKFQTESRSHITRRTDLKLAVPGLLLWQITNSNKLCSGQR